jgi:adenylate kinase
MRLVLVGPPGSGKGTQAKLLTDRLGLRCVGTGDLLREAIRHGTSIGKVAEPLLKAGKLVPDDWVNALVEELFHGPSRPNCFVLDGYPRTLKQAEWFDEFLGREGIDLTAVVLLEVPDAEVKRRMEGRRVCPACKAVYHVDDHPPKVPGICDVCGAKIVTRDDDREEVIRKRLDLYHATTDEFVEHYRKRQLLREVQSQGSPESIYNTIIDLLKVQA